MNAAPPVSFAAIGPVQVIVKPEMGAAGDGGVPSTDVSGIVSTGSAGSKGTYSRVAPVAAAGQVSGPVKPPKVTSAVKKPRSASASEVTGVSPFVPPIVPVADCPAVMRSGAMFLVASTLGIRGRTV